MVRIKPTFIDIESLDSQRTRMTASSTRFFGLLTLALASACFGSSSGDGATDQGTTGGTSPSSTTAGASSSGPTATSPTNPSASSSPPTTGTLPPGSGCCDEHEGPGCNESAVQECVCDMDATCCGFDWSASCVDIAQARCEATCQPDATTGDSTTGPTTGMTTSPPVTGETDGGTTFGSSGFGSGSTGDFGDFLCCSEGAGCGHAATEACVCAIDSSCCEGEWTETCVGLAASDCNACTNDDCCAPQNDAGCNDTRVQDCVCELDPYCCDTEYDYICAEVASGKCGACGE